MARRNRKKRIPARAAGSSGRGLRLALWITGALLLGTLFGGGAYFGYRFLHTHPALSLRQIELHGAVRTKLQTVMNAAALNWGMNLFEVDPQACSTQLEGLPWVKKARVERLMPDRILIELEEWQPAVLVSAGGLYLADAEGNIFKRASAEDGVDLTVISGLEEKSLLQNPEETRRAIKNALALLDKLQRLPCLQEKRISGIHLDKLMGPALVLDPGSLPVYIDRDAVDRPELLCRALRSVAHLPVTRLRLDHTNRGWQVVAALAPVGNNEKGNEN